MVVDHVGYLFFPEVWALRVVGRLAFPIFAFLIAEGYRRTSNPNAYLLRLIVFAVISEVPYDLFARNRLFYPGSQNIFFTLAAGLFSLMLYDKFMARRNEVGAMLGVFACCVFCVVIQASYMFSGVLLIFAFYVNRDWKHLVLWFGAIVLCNAALVALTERDLYWALIQTAQVFALPLIGYYNGRQGRRLKYFFYVFYPAHMLVLYTLRWVV